MKRFHLIAAVSFTAALLAAAAVPAPQRTQGTEGQASLELVPAEAREPLVLPGPAPDLEILFSSEVKGYYQPCG